MYSAYDYWDNADALSYEEYCEEYYKGAPTIEDLIREKEEREARKNAYLNLHSFSRIG